MKKTPQTEDREQGMQPAPKTQGLMYTGSGKLSKKVALITGGDSGIGRSVAIHFAREGADLAVTYLKQTQDARLTQALVEREGRRCLILRGDLGKPSLCSGIVQRVLRALGKLDILVNNAAEQRPQQDVSDIPPHQWEKTFQTNIFSYFYMSRAALPVMKPGSCIINTASVTAYRGSKGLLDYASSKGAIVSFTRSLSLMLAQRRIRVNAVAPGAVWTPLVASTLRGKKLRDFGKQNPMGRPGQPEEIAPSFVFLASNDSSFMSGQVLHPNGGEIING